MTALGKNRAQKIITIRFNHRTLQADMGLQLPLIEGDVRSPAVNVAEDCFKGRVDENVL
jgi:hypothetical protein